MYICACAKEIISGGSNSNKLSDLDFYLCLIEYFVEFLFFIYYTCKVSNNPYELADLLNKLPQTNDIGLVIIQGHFYCLELDQNAQTRILMKSKVNITP